MKSLTNNIGISVGTLLPFSGTPVVPLFSSLYTAWIVNTCNLGYIQGLPTNGISPLMLDILKVKMQFVENRWNNSTWWKFLFKGNPDSAMMHDLLFFPKNSAKTYRSFQRYGALPIQHSMSDWEKKGGGLIEIHKGLGNTHDILKQKQHIQLTFDTRHARFMEENWKTVFSRLAHRITHIHIQGTSRIEWDISGTTVECMLRYIAKSKPPQTLYWTIEQSPEFLGGFEMSRPIWRRNALRKMVETVAQIIYA